MMASSTEERPAKDVLNREDATTMAAAFSVPASNEEDSKSPFLPMDPRLLMAARDGDFRALKSILMNRQEEQTPNEAHVIIQLQEEANPNQFGNSATAEAADHPGDSVAEAGPCIGYHTDHSVGTHNYTVMLPDPELFQMSEEINFNPPGDSTSEGTNQPGNSIEEVANQSDDSICTPLSETLGNSTDIAEEDVGADANLLPEQQATADAVEEGGQTSDPVLLLNGVTFDSEQDSALHLVATFGNNEQYLKCAEIIYQKAKYLLDAVNEKGETPLQCAATAGNTDMVDLLIKMAEGENRSAMRVKELLRKKNKIGETVLHGAMRSRKIDLIKNLMSKDSELACIPSDGTSPLYLAISLRLCPKLVRKLFVSSRFSCSGPDGRNILHLAVFRSKVLQDLLEWCLPAKILTRQADIYGSTPLHFAASVDGWDFNKSPIGFIGFPMTYYLGFSFWFLHHMRTDGPTKLLIEANKHSLCQPDRKGLYPIHVAAASGSLKAIFIILESFPSCATLRDSRGRTFLHIAVEEKIWFAVAFVCRSPQFSSILNMKDNNGNSALHLAVEAGDQDIFSCLFQNHRVRLDISNKDGLTVRDLAAIRILGGGEIYNPSNPRYFIHHALRIAKAPSLCNRRDHLYEKYDRKIDEGRESQNLTNEAQVMGIVSILVATVTFAAAFTLPGRL